MDSFSHQFSQEHKSNTTTHHPQKHHQPSSSDLMSSAKYLAEAAQSALHHETDKVDKGRVAGAAADILSAASHYGKLEEKSFGKQIEKAEEYLQQYHSSHSLNSTTTTHSGHSTNTTTTHSASHSLNSTTTTHSGHSTNTTTTHSASHSDDGDGEGGNSGSGYGEYFKMAEGFLKKY